MARTRPNACWRCWQSIPVRMSWRPWSGRCATARFPLRPCSASWRRGASPRPRWTRWPTTIEPTWRGCSIVIRRRHAPPPTIKTCCARDLNMAERSDPRGKTASKVPNRATATRRSLHDDVTAALETLGVALPPDALDAALSAAEQESLSPLAFLHRLLAGPAEARRQRALERRIREAHFREVTTLDGFDWTFNAKGLERRAVEQLATCNFVRRRENVILVGQTGLGKSRILQSVGHAACVLGYRVRYATSARLLQEST